MDLSSAGSGGNSLPSVGPDGQKRRVCYFYDPEVGNYYYGQGHPMKPHRIRMTHSLLARYGLLNQMQVYRPIPARDRDLCRFHADDYINFLRSVTPETQQDQIRLLKRFNVGEDCPVFDGLYSFCQTYAGASVGGAVKLNHGHDIAINWSGGLHHAKKCEASGFCYVNDIVLAILELLKHHERVLYVDIDIHHGDGVEEAFYTTDRVMTVSFHKFGDYFPGTGDIRDIGHSKGKYYSLNVPLDDGIDDESYQSLFKPIMGKTGVALGQELEDKMPVNEYYEYFGPDYTLHVAPSNMENKNKRHQLDDIRSKLLDNLSKLRHAPSVQFQERVPDTELPEPDEDQADPDERHDPDSDMEVDDHKAVEESTRRSNILGIRVKREFGENETKVQDASRVTSEHKGMEPIMEDIDPSKQVPADANAMAIDEPGNVKNEPESSTKVPDQSAMYHKP
nr:unnamed protein product [Digitaria exilis]